MGTLYQFAMQRQAIIQSTNDKGGKIVIQSVKNVVLATVDSTVDDILSLSEELLLKTIQLVKTTTTDTYIVVG